MNPSPRFGALRQDILAGARVDWDFRLQVRRPRLMPTPNNPSFDCRGRTAGCEAHDKRSGTKAGMLRDTYGEYFDRGF